MNLNNYHAATSLIKSMEDGPQFVRIISGVREGTVGRVVSVRSKYYSAHDYQLSVNGRRSFWMKGSELEHLADWKGGTHFVEDRETTPRFNDLMGRTIEIGHTILFPRGTEGARVDMVMGTVKKISDKGAIYAKLFKSAQGNKAGDLVRVGKPTSAMILDGGTVNQVMLAKLSMF
jgi:hypothetical protein